MGSRILHDLSQELASLLEAGLHGDEGQRVPVFFCHPLDPFEDQPPHGTFGILYMTRIAPDPAQRHSGIDAGSVLDAALKPRLFRPPLWVRARYVFLVAGGDVEQQLVAMAAALQTLHDQRCVRLPPSEVAGNGSEDFLPASDADDSSAGDLLCPLQLVDDDAGWRDLGLQEHRLTLSFEVTCPIPSSPTEPVDRIQERGLRVEEGAP